MKAEEFKIKILPINKKLYRFAYRMLKDTMEAQDAVQEVYIKLWALRDKLEIYDSIEAFAMKVTRNLCLDKIKAKRTVSLEAMKNNSEQIVSELTPQNQLEITDMVNKVKGIIEFLPELQKTIIQLRDIEGYEFNEIAEIMEISINTIRVNLSRARKKVRETLIRNYNYGSEKNRGFIEEIL